MGKYNKKMIISGICSSGLLLLICIIQAIVKGVDDLSTVAYILICGIAGSVTSLRWYVMFDTKFKNSSFISRRVAHFVPNEPDLNALMFNTYKWFFMVFILVFISILS